MPVETLTPSTEIVDHLFVAELIRPADGPSSWVVVFLPQSREYLGTGKAVKLTGTIDGEPFASSALPTKGGDHLLGVKAAIRKKIGKDEGDLVTIELDPR
jgi:hypothetical protein